MSIPRVRRAGCARLALVGIGCAAALALPVATAAQSEAAQSSKTTLNIWYAADDLPASVLKSLNKQFEKANPGVTIKGKWLSGSDLQTVGKLSLSSNNPPDASQIAIPYPVVGQLVQAGKLTSLSGYAKKYGWANRFASSDYNLGRWNKNGVEGKGNLYGIYQTIAPVGIYYNKALLQKLGVGIPKTWNAFTSDLAVAKSKGELPVMFGNLDKWPALHVFYTIEDQMVSKTALRDFESHTQDLKPAGNVQAAALLHSWATSGYFPSGYQGLSYDDSVKQFGQGQGVFMITGTWVASQLNAKKFGFILPPPAGHSGPVATSGTNQLWLVPGKSPHPALAAAYLNFISNARAGLAYAKVGLLPGMKLAQKPHYAPGSLYADVYQAGNLLEKTSGSVPYIDVTTPSMYDTLTSGLQSVLGGQESPSDFLKSVQSDYAGSK